MPKRSSKRDANETAHEAVIGATDDTTGPELLAEVIGALREGMEEGATDEDLAHCLWPRLSRVLAQATSEHTENPAVTLGRKGGKKGGKARADKLSPDRRKEIARRAARARWGTPELESRDADE